MNNESEALQVFAVEAGYDPAVEFVGTLFSLGSVTLPANIEITSVTITIDRDVRLCEERGHTWKPYVGRWRVCTFCGAIDPPVQLPDA